MKNGGSVICALLLACCAPAQEAAPPPGSPRAAAQVFAAPRPLAKEATTTDWPGFLGIRRDGICDETHLCKQWPPSGPPRVWEIPTGSGYSAPSVQGERLVFFHRVGDEEIVDCLHPETGERYWDDRAGTTYRDSFGYNNGPRCTPLIEADRVYTYGVQGHLVCRDLVTGHRLWERQISEEFGVPQDFFGVVSTPVLHGGLLIVHVGAPEGPCVIALDKRTGSTKWSRPHPWRAGYSSPVIGRIHGQDRLLVFAGGKSRPTSGGLLCMDPDTGAIDFEFPWRSRSYESVNAACPVLLGDRVFVSASYQTGGAMIRILPDFSPEVQWTSEVLGTHFNTAIAVDEHLYGFDGRNEPDAALVCQEAATGKEVWREVLEWTETIPLESGPRERTMSPYRGMLLRADGAFLCLGEQGHLLWLDLTPRGCRVLARHWLFAARETWTPPVIHRGLLYVTQNDRSYVDRSPPRLLCYDLRGE